MEPCVEHHASWTKQIPPLGSLLSFRSSLDIQCSQRAFDLGVGGLGKKGSSKARHGPSTLPSPDRQLEAAFLGCILTLTSPI